MINKYFSIYVILVWVTITLVLVIRSHFSKPKKYITDKYSWKTIFFSRFPFGKSWEKGIDNDDINVMKKYQKQNKILFIIFFVPSFYFLFLYLTSEKPNFENVALYAATQKIQILEKAITNFNKDIKRNPTSNEALIVLISNPDNVKGWKGPYIKYLTTLEDYWGNKFKYLSPSKYGTKAFDLYSLGVDGIDDYGLKDDITNWSEINKKYYKNINFK